MATVIHADFVHKTVKSVGGQKPRWGARTPFSRAVSKAPGQVKRAVRPHLNAHNALNAAHVVGGAMEYHKFRTDPEFHLNKRHAAVAATLATAPTIAAHQYTHKHHMGFGKTVGVLAGAHVVGGIASHRYAQHYARR